MEANSKRRITVNKDSGHHIPVLLSEVLAKLSPKREESYLDLTAGYGGHAEAILERTFQPERATLVDRDQNATAFLRNRFGTMGATIVKSDFLSHSQKLKEQGAQFDMILVDLGVSSPHMDEAARGFSLQLNGPLDMRMDQDQQLDAKAIVNNYSQASLEELLRRYGEEPRARQIARAIVDNRPITSTHQLATIVAYAWPGYSRIHPATRSFQAIRMAVNDELTQLVQSLPIWLDLLSPGGRLAVISFHSLEDREVKRFFADHSGTYDAVLSILTKKPITGSKTEIVSNPRARSAKLRAAAKIKI